MSGSTSKFLKHLPCTACGSSDANSLYDDGHQFCSICKAHVKSDGTSTLTETENKIAGNLTKPGKPVALEDRSIGRAAAEKYGIWRDDKGTTYFPYYKGEDHHASKVRRENKQFHIEGNIAEAGLFGSQLFPPGSTKFITLVEGEYDAPAAYELLGSRWPVVSVRNGASGAAKDVADNFEYLNSFPTIVICFDRDEAKIDPISGKARYPGQEAAQAVAGMFAVGRVKVLSLQEHKDPNEYLKAKSREQFNREWWAAPTFTPTGLRLGRDMWADVESPKDYESVEYPWPGMNEQTYGIRMSEFVLLVADTGIGKTTILKEIEYHIRKQKPDIGIGLLHLEETNADTALGLMSIEASLPLHLPDIRETISKEDLRGYFDRIVDTDRLVIYDHFGSNNVQEILNKVRHMHNLGCRYIVLDHLSIVVSDQSGDERKQLDEIATKLKTLCMELNISVLAIIHTNRQGQVRGTAGVEQLANIVIKAHREKLSEDPWRRNVIKMVIEKNRFCGRTGPAEYLWYNPDTGRLIPLTEEQKQIYIGGGAAPDHQW